MGLFNEQQQEQQIFSFGIDETARAHMLETVRWGKFLAILGFIFLALLIAFGLLSGFVLSALDTTNTLSAGMGIGMMFVYLLIAGLYFYPTWALYKFSVLSKEALNTFNQQQFNESLRYLKNMFKFFGVITIVMLALYGIGIVFAMLGAAVGGF